MNEDDPNLPPTSDSDRLGAGPSARSYSQSQSHSLPRSNSDPDPSVPVITRLSSTRMDPDPEHPPPHPSFSSSSSPASPPTSTTSPNVSPGISTSASATAISGLFGLGNRRGSRNTGEEVFWGSSPGSGLSGTATTTQTQTSNSNSNSMMGVSISPPAPPVGFNPPPASHPSSTGSSPGSPLNLNSNTIGPGSTTTTGRISSVSLGEASGGGEKMVGWPFGQSHSPSLLGQEEQVRFGSYHSGQREQTGGAAGANASASASASPSAGAAAGTGERTGGSTAGSSASSSSGTSEGSGRNRTGLRGMVGTNEQGAVGSTGSGSGVGQGQGQGYAQGQGQGQGSGSGSGQGINRSVLSSPRSSVSSITLAGLARRTSGGRSDSSRSGSNRGSISNHGGPNPFDLAALGGGTEKITPPAEQITRSGMGRDEGDELREAVAGVTGQGKSTASEQLDRARQNLNDEKDRVFGLSRQASLAGLVIQHPQASPMEYNAVAGKSVTSPSSPVLGARSPTGSLRRSSSDDGRSAGSRSPSRSSSSAASGSRPETLVSPGGVVAPSTLLGVDTITSPISYTDQSSEMFSPSHGRGSSSATTGDNASISSSRSGSSPIGQNRRGELGRWSTAREVRNSPPGKKLPSPAPSLQRSFSHESHRHERASTEGAQGNVHMWDSVWPTQTSNKAVDPVTALPVSHQVVGSPALVPLIPPLGMHSRSMSASVVVNSPNMGSPADSYNRARRDSGAGVFGRPAMNLGARPSTPGQLSPPGSPLSYINPQTRSLPMFRSAKKSATPSSGSATSKTSPTYTDRAESPLNSTDLPMFSAPRGPGSPRAIPTMMNRYFSETDVPGLIFTQPTPTPEVSLSRPSDDERTNTFDTADSLLASSPPLALPPALASPEPAPAAGPSTLAASPAISEKSSGSGTPVKAASVARPVPPPFRRALSHVNAASPPLQASTSPRPRAYSGSTSTMARPAMVSQNSGYSASRQRSGQASPLQQPRVVSPAEDSPPQSIGSDRGPSPTIRVSPDKEENDRSPPAKSPVAKSKSSSGGISGESISPPSIGNSSHLDADDEASPVLPDSAIMKDISIEPQSDVFDESFDAVQQDYNPPVIADTELHGSGTLNSDADEVMAVPTDTLPADVAFEDEGLLTLERIFLLSKSEHAFHRAYIARTLGDLLEDTDPCEAVEYVIPLLTGFALDEDESVKEAFASQLHKVLWYFFTSCDLIGEEDEILASEDPSKDPVFAITSEGVRALRRSDTALGAPGDIGPRLPGSGSGSSGSTSWNSSEGSSAGAASLNSRKESISSSTDMTTGTPASSIETPGSVITADTSQSVHAAAQRDKEMSKDLFQGTEEQPDLDAGPLLDRPIIPVHIFTPLIGSLLLSQNSLVADPARAAVVAVLGKLRKADIPILDEWPEERPEGVKLAYTAQSGSHSHDIPMFSVISRRMVQKELLEGIVIGIGRLHEDRVQSRKGSDGSSIIGAAPDQGDQTDSGLQRTVSRASGQPGTVSSDGADSEAAFLKQQLAQEAVLGRAISMNLIASISEFLQDHEIARYDLVTEVARTLEDEPGVKAEAALALAYLAKQAPQDHIEVMLSLFEHFVEDENEAVRQSACLCLPALSKRIENLEHRRSYTVRAFEALLDSGDLVEYTLLEIIGEIIHIFQDDPEGPPLELLEVFYSQAPVNQASSEDELIREFDNLDRAIVSAFNLPAVCLALGPERWAELRPTYKALCNINHQRIIASLAAAVHELAKILGPEISAYDLLPSFTEYIHGADEAKVKVLGGLPSFVSSLPVDEALAVIDELSAMWIGGSLPNWRHREALASHFAALLKHMASVGEASTALGLLNHGLADTFQAIREATITNMPSCYGSVKDDKTSSDQIMNMLKDLAISGNFKQRRTYIACVEAFVKQKCSSEFFEEHFLDDLAVLSDDLLDVRISVAKCLGPICARDGLYPHSPLRPLRLNEIVERLSNDDSQYVRDPIAKIVVRPRIRPGGPSGIWSNGPYVYTPGSTGSHPSRSSPPDRRSSSASLLIRADSDSTIRQGNFGYQDKEEVSSGTQSAPSEMMFVPWSSPDLGESLGRPISMQEAQRMLGVEAEPVKVGMKDPFSANFGRAVAKAQSLHNNDKIIKRF